MKRPFHKLPLILAGALVTTASLVRAQFEAPFDVTASRSIVDASGEDIGGGNQAAAKHFKLAAEEGGLVQVLLAGADGVPNLPGLNGEPGGDDTVFATTRIGAGMAPNVSASGRFSASFHPPPPRGARVFVRVFDRSTVKASSRWGQSSTFTVDGPAVMDVSRLGLWAAGQIVGVDPASADTDGDGMTNLEELYANTNASDAADVLTLRAERGRVIFAGKAGRAYRLMKAAHPDGPWQLVDESSLLPASQPVTLSDPRPDEMDPVFYRLEAWEMYP